MALDLSAKRYGSKKVNNSQKNAASNQSGKETSKQPGSGLDLSPERYGSYDARKSISYVNNWLSESKRAIADMDAYYRDNKDKYATDFGGEAAERVKKQIYSAFNVKKSLEDNKELFENYDDVMSSYEQYFSYLRDMDISNYKMGEFYSQFDSEESYNAARQVAQWEEKYQGKSYDNLSKTLAGMEDGEEKKWLKAYAKTVMTPQDYDRQIQARKAEMEPLEELIGKAKTIINGTYGMGSEEEDKRQKKQIDTMLQEAGYNSLSDAEERLVQLKRENGYDEDSRKYLFLNENGDFAEKSAAATDKRTAGFGISFGTKRLGFGDETYDYINDLEGTREKIQGEEHNPYTVFDQMEQGEIDRYNYLYNTEGREVAEDYLDYLKYSLNERQMSDAQLEWKDFSTKHPALSSVASVPTNLASGMGILGVAAQHAAQEITGNYKPIDYNRGTMTPTVFSSTVRGTVSQNIVDDTGSIQLKEADHPILSRVLNGKSLGDVYQLGMSMVDSAAIAALSPLIGSSGTLLLGGSAASQGMLDALEAGATDSQALTMGILNGTFEALFEYLPMENLLKGFVPKNAVLSILKQGTVEGLEELGTTFANTIADAVVMAENSNFQKSMRKYMEKERLNEKQAFFKALGDAGIQMGWDFVGGLISGGIMGAGAYPIQNYTYHSDLGQALYGDNHGALVTEALETDGNNDLAKKMKGQLDSGQTVKNHDLWKLAQQVADTQLKQDIGNIREAAAERLSALGETENVEAVSSAIARQAAGEKLSRAEQAAIDKSKYGKRVANELNADNIQSGDYASAWTQDIGTKQVDLGKYPENSVPKGVDVKNTAPEDTAQSREKAAQQRESQTAAEAEKESQSSEEESYDVSAEGKTILRETGETVDIQEIGSIQDGKMTLKLADGRTVDASEVAYATEDEALVYATMAELGITPGTANALISTYRGDVPLRQYTNSIRMAVYDGRYSLARDLQTNPNIIGLTDAQKQAAYDAGQAIRVREYAKAQEAARKAKTRNMTADTAEKKNTVQRGGVKLVDGKNASDFREAIQKAGKKLSGVQDTAISTMEKLSAAMGVEFRVYESYVNDAGKRVYLDEKGQEQHAPNGWYDAGNDTVYIDLNAGQQGRGVMLYTVSHELTHYIRQWSPEKFRVMADVLMNQYGESGTDVRSLIENQMTKARKNGRTIDFDTAYEEVVADSMEDILTSGNVVEVMAEMKQRDSSLWEKIKGWFRKLAEDIRKVVDAYKDESPDSAEGRAVSQMKDFLTVMEGLYSDALLDAGENARAADGYKNTATEGVVKYSLNRDAQSELHKALYDTNYRSEVLLRDESPAIMLAQKGVKNLPMVMKASHIRENVFTESEAKKLGLSVKNGINYHGLGESFFLQIIDGLDNVKEAYRGTKNADNPSRRENYFLLVSEFTDQDGNTINVPVYINEHAQNNSVFIDVNKISTVYGKNNFRTYIRNQTNKGNLVRIKNRSNLTSERPAPIAGGYGKDASTRSIRTSDEKVNEKFSMRDNVEETNDLIAVHNLSEEKLLKNLQLGGLPMPSIAILRAQDWHSEFGDISLVFGKDTIDPEVSRRNKVYSGDAWTPTYPRIEYKPSEKALKSVSKKISQLVPGDIRSVLGSTNLDLGNVEDALNRNGGNMTEAYRDNLSMKYAYLKDTGADISLPSKESDLYQYGEVSNDAVRYFSGKLVNGLQTVELYQNMSAMDMVKDKDLCAAVADALNYDVLRTMEKGSEEYAAYEKAPAFSADNVGFHEIHGMLIAVRKFYNNGVQKTVDRQAARELIDSKVDQASYESWLNELFSGIVEKDGIRNNKDYFTPSGNRRSFEALHYENNLENVIKAMRESGEKGIGSFGTGSIFGAATTEFSSVDEMKKAEGRLRKIDPEEYEKIKEGFSDRFFEIAGSLPQNRNSFTAMDDAANMLIEAVAKYKTRSGMAGYLRRESQGWANYSDHVLNDLLDLVNDIRNMPTGYFEAKPQRAVGFDEVATAVIPDSASKEIRTGLDNAGVKYVEYESGNDQARLEALNAIDNVKFSDRDSDGNELSEQQREYFKDSKVRSENGNLLVMYHGTPNGGFTKFRPGTYFTQNREYADRYQNQAASMLSYKKTADNPTTYQAYLNIKKPFDTRNARERRIFMQEYYRQYGTGAPLSESGLPDWTDGMDLQEFIEDMGYDYDGLILDEGATGGYGEAVKSRGLSYVVFDPAQVKNVDNRNPTSDPDIRFSDREAESNYAYDTLVKKPDMALTVVDGTVPGNRADVVAAAKKNAVSVGKFNKDGSVSVFVNDIGKDVVLTTHGLAHGLDRRLQINGLVTMKAGEILQNSIRINELTPAKANVSESYVLIGAAKDRTGGLYVVRSVINRYSNELSSMDVLYAINAKKESAALNEPAITDSPLRITDSTIRVADILEYVNQYFPDILPEDVLRHYGYDRRPDGKLGESALYSDRDPEAEKVSRVLARENEQLKEDVQYLKQMLKLQKSVTGGKVFKRDSVDAAARYLMKNANVKGDWKALSGLLNEFYTYIAAGEELTWEGVVEAAQPAVKWLQENMQESQARLDSYAAEVLGDIRKRRISLDDSQKAEAAHMSDSFGNWRKSLMGSVIISNDGMALDSAWVELSQMYPTFFPADTTSTDMPRVLAESIGKLRSMTEEPGYAYDTALMAQDLTRQVYDSYWRASTLHTVADVKQRQINRMKEEHSQRMREMKADHRAEVAELHRQWSEEIEAVRTSMKYDAEQKQNEIIKGYRESRKQGVENRRRTAMRHKVQGVVKELNDYLLKGTKERHVPIELQKAVAEALDTVNMDTVGAEDRIAKLKEELMKAKTPEKVQEISRKIDHVQSMGENMNAKLKALKYAYESFTNSDDPMVADAQDDVISAKMESVIASVGNTSIRDMTTAQLEDVYDMYKMVLTTVRNANKAFKAEKAQSISEMSSKVMEEVRNAGGVRKYNLPAMEAINKFGWNNLKPVYAFEHIGSQTLTNIFNNVRSGEDVWAKDVSEAREFYLEKTEKYNVDKWDTDKRYDFESSSGKQFSLDIGQIMSLYAYSKREQAADHIRRGGIVIDESTEVAMKTKLGVKMKFNPTEATAYNISDDALLDIISKLTPEQRAFVDEMQTYLSDTMGGKGNEVSLELYGIKLFKDKNYFPLKSAQQYMAKAKEQQSGEVKIKNAGFSKETVAKASNPIVLTPFMDVWADHVNEMSMYHAFVLPMEDFYRVYNYRTATSEKGETSAVNATIQNAYGKGATGYIDQLLKDLNGGARVDQTTGIITKSMNLFKKGAVFASASVVIQQPSAIGRATALIDPKYFVGAKLDKKKHNATWKEVKKYAPVAAIKEMGYFDTNLGKSTRDFLLGKEYKGFSEKAKAIFTDGNYRDEFLSKAPALADEVTWCSIWEAVKRETRAKNPGVDIHSEEFLQKAGERFTEVIVKTQVYDSVLSRSANMRSKDTGMKMATAFMAEPTTAINMVADALRRGKNGTVEGRWYCRRAIGSVVAAQILNSILVSFVYAARDDDDDETYMEKYVSSFLGGMMDSLNPMTYIPFLKDITSIVGGYAVERSDMAVISDLWNAWKQLDNENVSGWRKVEDFAGSICRIFGLPVKNIMRDVRSVYQAYETIFHGEKETWAGMRYAVKEGITGDSLSNAEQLYDARMQNDYAHEARVEARYGDEDSANAAVRSVIKDRYMDDRLDESEALKQMVLYTGMDASEAHWLMNEWKYRKNYGSDDGYSKYGDFFQAVQSGKNLKNIVQEYVDNGVEKKTLLTQITDHFKPEYVKMSKADRANIKGYLVNAMELCGRSRDDAMGYMESWDFEAEYGFAYSDRKQAYLDGKVTAQQLKTILVNSGNYSEEDAEGQIEVYEWNKQGYDGATISNVRRYAQYCESTGIPKDVFLEVVAFSNNTENDVDESGKTIYYSAVKKVMEKINQLPLTDEQKTALAYSMGWREKTVEKYKLW